MQPEGEQCRLPVHSPVETDLSRRAQQGGVEVEHPIGQRLVAKRVAIVHLVRRNEHQIARLSALPLPPIDKLGHPTQHDS